MLAIKVHPGVIQAMNTISYQAVSRQIFKKYHKMVSSVHHVNVLVVFIFEHLFSLVYIHEFTIDLHLPFCTVSGMQRMVNQLGTSSDSDSLRKQL
jgi:hypothetical protein